MTAASNPEQPRRPYRSAEEWLRLIEAYESSGLSQSEFCTQRELSSSSFYQWLKRYRDDNKTKEVIHKAKSLYK